MRRHSPLLLALVAFGSPGAQTTKPSTSVAPRPPIAISAIHEADLRRDLYALAGDEMRGREAGTVDEIQRRVFAALAT